MHSLPQLLRGYPGCGCGPCWGRLFIDHESKAAHGNLQCDRGHGISSLLPAPCCRSRGSDTGRQRPLCCGGAAAQGTLHGLATIVREERVRGLFRGVVPTVATNVTAPQPPGLSQSCLRSAGCRYGSVECVMLRCAVVTCSPVWHKMSTQLS